MKSVHIMTLHDGSVPVVVCKALWKYAEIKLAIRKSL